MDFCAPFARVVDSKIRYSANVREWSGNRQNIIYSSSKFSWTSNQD
jgi:hypothetical protein